MWVAVGVMAAASVYSAVEADKARDEAKDKAKKDKADALRAQQFAEEEGEGIGQLGNINLSIDDTLDDDLKRQGKSNLSI